MLRAPSPALAFALGSTGFSAISLEFIFILSLQIWLGCAYSRLAFVISAFMAGAWLGAHLQSKAAQIKVSNLMALEILLALLACLCPLLNSWAKENLLSWDIYFLPSLCLLTIFTGYLSGAQFALISSLALRRGQASSLSTASWTFSTDFLASSLGALLSAAFLVPLLGLARSCFLLTALKLTSLAILAARRKTLLSSSAAKDQSPIPAADLTLCAIFVLMAIGIYSNSTNATLYVLSFAAPYHWLLFALLAWGIVRAVWRVGASREAEASCSQAGLIRKLLTPQSLGVFRWSNYLLLALVVVYPLFRCFFSLPYIFCHVCPRKCVFGFLRPYLIPAALIMNMERQQWCTQACPLGTMQDAQTRLAASNKVLPRFWKVLPYAVLLFTLVIYFKVLGDYRHTTQSLMDAFTFFFRNEYSPHVLVIMALLILLGVAWRYQRPFCSLLCPLGACSSLIARIGKSISHQDLPKNIASGDTKNG